MCVLGGEGAGGGGGVMLASGTSRRKNVSQATAGREGGVGVRVDRHRGGPRYYAVGSVPRGTADDDGGGDVGDGYPRAPVVAIAVRLGRLRRNTCNVHLGKRCG